MGVLLYGPFLLGTKEIQAKVNNEREATQWNNKDKKEWATFHLLNDIVQCPKNLP